MASASTSLLIFIVITIVYFLLKTYSPSQIKVWTIVYFLILIISQFFVNLSLTNDICGFNQYNIAFMVTAIPWVVVFGILNVLLLTFPNWLSPFSNTIGYMMCNLFGINGFFIDILNDKKNLNLVKNKNIIETINHIYTDKSLLINEITLDDLPNWWSSMKSANILKSSVTDEDYNTLKSYLNMKNNISEFIWYILTGGLVTSVSYNYIVNSGCQQSVDEMKKRHDEYVEKEDEIDKAKQEKKEIVYKSYE